MHRTTAYVGHFLARFERDVKLYMACAALIGFSAFGIYSVLFNLYLLRMDYDVGSIGHFNAVRLAELRPFQPDSRQLGAQGRVPAYSGGGYVSHGHGVSIDVPSRVLFWPTAHGVDHRSADDHQLRLCHLYGQQ